MPFTKENASELRAKAAPRGENKLKRLFKEYADAEDIKDLFDELKDMAFAEDVTPIKLDAIKTMLAYLIGKPRETKDITLDASITDKRTPSWFRSNPDHISIINTEVKSELQ